VAVGDLVERWGIVVVWLVMSALGFLILFVLFRLVEWVLEGFSGE
jgi:hypothetical protein